MRIKTLIINGTECPNFETTNVDKDGNETSNLPTLAKFKLIAIETCIWEIGNGLKQHLGGETVKQLTAISKSTILIAKVAKLNNPDLSGLSEKEKIAFDKHIELADKGYADSDLLIASLSGLDEIRDLYYLKVSDIQKATTQKQIIDILNR